ncbi:Uncharacterised protein [Cedecea neteri]|uniref:Uncharacterized protein n=1 Tax=Cedecea neteri TaxID=158822 RepID=A0A2X3ING1_9ENTR|nr:Uncharacterised protein [Cedecea neteri]
MLANVSPGIFLAIFNDETIITIKIIIVLINCFYFTRKFRCLTNLLIRPGLNLA